ncbi:hypothetical protein VTK73DRAFT_6447 [Phialemonium thermophilum]|uniref:Tubby C 2 n=1 Tax=Phialemonium thermophilum TaxID=223376 RepID=A0ABR3WK59_9PEZI
MAAIQLPPLPHQIGIFDHFVARKTETLVLREKALSLSGDSFDIHLLGGGPPLLTVKGNALSLSGRKAVYDASGKHLFDIKREHLHLHTTFAVVDPQDNRLMEVKSSMSLIGSKATATFTTPRTGRAESLQMKGNWLDSRAEIVDTATGAVVAIIDRQMLSGRDIFLGKQTYALICAPGVDMALMAAMCICLDEKRNDA